MTTISTISELLTLSNCQFRVYDIGRKIEKVSKTTFEKIEHCHLPHPTPFQGHSHFAITFWQKASHQPYLWFVKLPLDERGLLNQGARNHFIAIIIEALGTNLSVDPTKKQEELLKNNPYIFTPSQYKLAMLNSLISFELKNEPTTHYSRFTSYLKDKTWAQWQHIGVQGIADFAARISEEDNANSLSQNLTLLPFEVLSTLCGALENVALPHNVVSAIVSHLEDNSVIDIQRQQMLLRALASSTEQQTANHYIDELLTQNILAEELVITIAGRLWNILNNQSSMMKFLELLVQLEPALFPSIFSDLVAIPTIRPVLFQCMRTTERSENLSKAIGQLFNNKG